MLQDKETDITRVSRLSLAMATGERLEDIWQTLCNELANFGFSRVLYARKPRGDRGNFHNLHNTLILSTYGPEIDRYFVEDRAFVFDYSTNWAAQNRGVVSWQETRDRYLSDKMSAAERRVHEFTRELGLIAGLTIGIAPKDAGYLSGIGLCIDPEFDQVDADRIWVENEDIMMILLNMFEGAVRAHSIGSKDEIPDEQRMKVLHLIIEGKSNREIGDILGVHRRTVESWLAHIRDQLGVANTLQAVVTLTQRGQL